MSAGLKGDVSSLTKFAASLRSLPRVLAHKVAEEAAPAITELAKASFEASETPYGVDWAPGADGKKVKLRKTGALARYIKYVAIGTKLRVALGVRYAKYQVGKRPVFPMQGRTLPATYVRRLQEITTAVARAHLGGAP